MAIIGVLKRNTCHIEECNANPYKSTRWQDQQLENIAKDKGKTERGGGAGLYRSTAGLFHRANADIETYATHVKPEIDLELEYCA